MKVRRTAGVVLVLLLVGGMWWLLPFGASFRASIIESVRGENPTRTALAYFDAIAAKDSAAAMVAWDDPQAAVLPERVAVLEARRQTTTQ